MEPVRSKFVKQNAGLDKAPKLFAGIICFRKETRLPVCHYMVHFFNAVSAKVYIFCLE